MAEGLAPEFALHSTRAHVVSPSNPLPELDPRRRAFNVDVQPHSPAGCIHKSIRKILIPDRHDAN